VQFCSEPIDDNRHEPAARVVRPSVTSTSLEPVPAQVGSPGPDQARDASAFWMSSARPGERPVRPPDPGGIKQRDQVAPRLGLGAVETGRNRQGTLFGPALCRPTLSWYNLVRGNQWDWHSCRSRWVCVCSGAPALAATKRRNQCQS